MHDQNGHKTDGRNSPQLKHLASAKHLLNESKIIIFTVTFFTHFILGSFCWTGLCPTSLLVSKNIFVIRGNVH